MMKKHFLLAAFCLFLSAVGFAQTEKAEQDTVYSVVDGEITNKFGVFIVIGNLEYDDAPFKGLDVEFLANIDKGDSKSGMSGWIPIVKAKVIRATKDEVEIEIMQDIVVETSRKGINYEPKKGQKVQIRWPEISY